MAWRDKALCKEYSPDNWFPKETTPQSSIDLALAICGICPVRARCAKVESEYGIFGGELRRLDFDS